MLIKKEKYKKISLGFEDSVVWLLKDVLKNFSMANLLHFYIKFFKCADYWFESKQTILMTKFEISVFGELGDCKLTDFAKSSFLH